MTEDTDLRTFRRDVCPEKAHGVARSSGFVPIVAALVAAESSVQRY